MTQFSLVRYLHLVAGVDDFGLDGEQAVLLRAGSGSPVKDKSQDGLHLPDLRVPFAQVDGTLPELRRVEQPGRGDRGAEAAAAEYAFSTSEPRPLQGHPGIREAAARRSGVEEFNKVLGGGVVLGSLVLIGGEPGIGKSTLLLQVSRDFAERGERVLYVSGEESLEQIKLRGDRLGVGDGELYLLAETSLERILAQADKIKPRVLVLDSVQTRLLGQAVLEPGDDQPGPRGGQPDLPLRQAEPGLARSSSATSPRRGRWPGRSRSSTWSTSSSSSRASATTATASSGPSRTASARSPSWPSSRWPRAGLQAIPNPSAFFLKERPAEAAGSVVVSTIKGTRPLLVEIQALVSPTLFAGNPRRMTVGLDHFRTAMLLAVIEKKARLPVSAARTSISTSPAGWPSTSRRRTWASSWPSSPASRTSPCPGAVVAFGEVGLSGEIRSVGQARGAGQGGPASGSRPSSCRRATWPMLEKEDLPGRRGSSGVQNLREALR